jgi:hypothetical protein
VYASFLVSLFDSLSEVQKLSLLLEYILISGITNSEDGRRK